MYTEYLFLSTNLKAKFPKFLDKAQWEFLINSDINDAINFLKETIYYPLLDGYSGFLKILSDDLKIFSGTVKFPYWDLMFFEFMAHDIRNELYQINFKERTEGYFNLPYTKFYYSLKKDIIVRCLDVWQQTNDLNLLNLTFDLEILKKARDFSNVIENKRVKNFWIFKNNLFWIKVELSLERSNLSVETLKKFGIDLIYYRTYFYNEELRRRFFEELKEFDCDFIIKKYLYNYLNTNFKHVVSGPEVVLFYFYNKIWDMEDILFILENKKAKIPKEYWERGLLKINV